MSIEQDGVGGGEAGRVAGDLDDKDDDKDDQDQDQDQDDDEDEDEDDDDDDDDDVELNMATSAPGTRPTPAFTRPGAAPVTHTPTTIPTGGVLPPIQPVQPRIAASQLAAQATSNRLDINAVGQYNDKSIFEFDLDGAEDKPWRKPGADISDYFNYGFNEETWQIYCEKQKSMRASVGSSGIGRTVPPLIPQLAGGSDIKPLRPAGYTDSNRISIGRATRRADESALQVLGGDPSGSSIQSLVNLDASSVPALLPLARNMPPVAPPLAPPAAAAPAPLQPLRPAYPVPAPGMVHPAMMQGKMPPPLMMPMMPGMMPPGMMPPGMVPGMMPPGMPRPPWAAQSHGSSSHSSHNSDDSDRSSSKRSSSSEDDSSRKRSRR
ncbi:hypothetical protein CAOG_08094 [Capsaspora owczarzaki ATCC 30864]|uniref:Pre-mRNA polyadenylation factor Fip1 domain-containing protein n=1 Tax=Capsaspora owczarzaki (strain ATCC 30864) TaxID=595528 RepID=A0A0D2USY0_CAPO3|nr:hypothetical protein CAOG_08094 [Capsaspora owczarzaki ATCC 30864]KJE98061.1 hypothetical protein CAOG_008094 [Capsaspora owczarzaki ATCC 30864]|eukprot:XP_004342695.1 hypothetical protein CAOG_08094 [Capsaspora owczarzaki ATCC 30864]